MTLRRALSPMLPNLDAQLAPYSRNRAVQSISHRSNTVHSELIAPPDSSVAQSTQLPEQLQVTSPCASSAQLCLSDQVRDMGSSLLGDVTNTAGTHSMSSPRSRTAAAPVSALGLEGGPSSPQSKGSSPDMLHKDFAGQQQQQEQCLDRSKGHHVNLSSQRHITVDTRGLFKQSVFHITDLGSAQTSTSGQQQAAHVQCPVQVPLANGPAPSAGTAGTYSHLQQQRMPFTECSDPHGNRISPPHSQQPPAEHIFALRSTVSYSTDTAQSQPEPHSMHALYLSSEIRDAQQSPGPLPNSPALSGSGAAAVANAEAVKLANRAALIQTSLLADQAEDSAQLTSAICALQPLVAAADLAQLQQCLPQVCASPMPGHIYVIAMRHAHVASKYNTTECCCTSFPISSCSVYLMYQAMLTNLSVDSHDGHLPSCIPR